MSGAEKSPASLSPDEMSERIGAFVAAEVGVAPRAVRVSALRRLPGGSSRETWSLELAIERAGKELVIEIPAQEEESEGQGASVR